MKEKQSKSVDMTVGAPGKLILSFAIPMILGNVVQQLYSMVDSAVIGRFVGKTALASIGATMSVLNLIICLIIGLTMGTCIITAQYLGAGKEEMVRDTAGTAVYIAFGMWLVIAILGALVSGPVLRLLKTPEDVMAGAQTYLLINTSTSLAPITYNLTANLMRSLGDSKSSLYALVCSSVLNIILDLVFVLAFGWGIAGVAWATAISQGVSTLVNLYRIRKVHPILRLSRSNLTPKADIVKHVIAVGLPMSLQNAVASVGMLGVQGIVNGYGTNTVAAYTAAGKIDQIALMPLNSLGMAVSTYVGQNYGKRDMERIRAGVRAGVCQVVAVSLILMAVIIPFGGTLTQLFVSAKETEVIAISREYLNTVSLFYWLCGIMYVFLNVFRGMEKMKLSTLSSCLDPVMKLISAVCLGTLLGRRAIWAAWPVGWAAALVLPLYFFLTDKWKA